MKTMIPAILSKDPEAFPDPNLALKEPNGLLAIGGDLSVKRLIAAYQQGIFPWYSEGQPMTWFSPDPRAILYPDGIKISRSLEKTLKHDQFQITFDRAFNEVIHACAEPRQDETGTWITTEMIAAYCRLHEQSIAHSVEVWSKGQLVGGLYGLAMGKVFFGESMFTKMPNASKVALVHCAKQLQTWHFLFIDCQLPNPHLLSMGALCIPRQKYLQLLQKALQSPCESHDWNSLP